MKSRVAPFKIKWVFIFCVVFIADLASVYLGEESFRQITKPVLMPCLILVFLRETFPVNSSLKKFIVMALVLSWAGDVFLLYEYAYKAFFIYGLSSFLMAHLFYILFFVRVSSVSVARFNWWLAALVILYFALLMYILTPNLGSLRGPVWIYGLVISIMLFTALQMLFIKYKTAGKLMSAGAILFVASDSLLALNKFYQTFSYAGFSVMLTYGLAQLLLVQGAISLINSSSKQ